MEDMKEKDTVVSSKLVGGSFPVTVEIGISVLIEYGFRTRN